MYEPNIEIRGKEASITTEDLLQGYDTVQRSLSTFFGPGQELQPGTVRTIEARHSSASRFTNPTFFAEWQQKKRKVVIIDRGTHDRQTDSTGSHGNTIVDNLGHELGHAYQMQLQEQFGSKKAVVTSEEGFADWIRIIAINEGDVRKVNSQIGRRLYEGVKLFDSITTDNPYPTEVAKLTDAALLNYVYREYGMDMVMKACTLPPLTTLPETLVALGLRPIAFPLDKFRFGQKILNKVATWHSQRLQKRYDNYTNNFSQLLGLSSLDELVKNAIVWYKEEERTYTPRENAMRPLPSLPKRTPAFSSKSTLHSETRTTQPAFVIPKRPIGLGVKR